MSDSHAPAGDAGTHTPFDVAEADRLLSTTRAVRKRLDFEREVPDQVLFDCIDAAEQAPTGGNDASRRWIVVRDPAVKAALGDIYARSGSFMSRVADRLGGSGHSKEKVFDSSAYLVENFGRAPVLVIAAIWGVHDDSGRPGLFDSVLQSAWSFNLALRARGLGTTWTTLLNANVDELAEVLGIPDGVTTVVTFPVAYTKGTDFRPVARRPASDITYFDEWGFTRSQASTDGGTRLEDGQGVVAEADIEALPAAVWPVISDINLPAGAGTELVSAQWQDEPGLGAVFTGRSRLGDAEWEVKNQVTAYEEGRVFEWSVVNPAHPDIPGAVWRFEIMDQGVGSRLRFSMRIGTSGNVLSQMAAKADDPAKVINDRRRILKANMSRTVEAAKAAVEAAGVD